MSTPVRLVAAAAALLTVMLGGSIFLWGGGSPEPAPTATPTPPSETPVPSPLVYDWPRQLDPGTYATRAIWDIPFELQFTVPDGWQSRDVEVISQELSVAFHLAGNTYSDPCERVLMDPPTGPTVDDLAAALETLPGFDANRATPVSVDGEADGRYLELVVREDAGCSTPQMWADPPDSYNGEGPVGPPAWGAEHPNMRMWILDVDGVRLVVSALWSDAATQADLDELEEVVDSFRILPGTGTPIALPSPD